MRSLVGLAVVSLTLVPTVHAHAQSSAAGRVTIAGKETELGHVRARVNAERTEFVLLLTDALVSPEPFSSGADPAKLAEVGTVTGVAIVIVPGKVGEQVWIFSPALKGGVVAARAAFDVDLSTFTTDRMAGRATFEPDAAARGLRYSFDLQFSAPIKRPPPVAAAVPAAEEVVPAAVMEKAMREATAAYLGFRQAVAAGNIEEIRRLSTSDRVDFDGADSKKLLKELRAQEPHDVSVVGGTADADLVSLILNGRDGSRRWRGQVFLVRREETWRVKLEGWDPAE